MSQLVEKASRSRTYHELINQPRSWAATLAAAPALAREALFASQDLYFTGCGSSYYLAQAAAGLVQEALKVPCRAVPASAILLVPEQVFTSRPALLFAFSRSGATTETVEAVRRAGAGGLVRTVAVTCAEGTPLAAAADWHLDLPHAADHEVVMTQSYTNMLLAVLVWAAELSGEATRREQLQLLPALAGEGLPGWTERARELAEDLSWRQTFFFGTGAYVGLAAEGALKLKEMTQEVTEAYQPLEFRHGPISLVREDAMAVLLRRERSAASEIALLEELRGLGARPVIVAPEGGTFNLGVGPDDWARAPLYVVPLQLLALLRCVARGLEPDSPRGLNRVVSLGEGNV